MGDRTRRAPRWTVVLALVAAAMLSACGQAAAPTIAMPTLRALPSGGVPLAPATPAAVPSASSGAAPSAAVASAVPSVTATRPTATDAPRPTPGPTVPPASPTAPPTESAAPTPAGTAPAAATQVPSEAPTEAPSETPTASPVLTALQVWTGDGPDADEIEILTHVPDGLFAYCNRIDPAWLNQVAAVNCQAAKVGVSYVSFKTQAVMQAAYDKNVADLNLAPSGSTKCGVGRYEGGYSIGGVHVGRWYCVDAVDQGVSYHEIEWTHERLHMIAFAASQPLSWTELIDFTDTAGPLAP